jgi:single-stranded-DNA-specific exonuclease
MPSIEKRWQVAPPIPGEVSQQLSSYPPLLRQILYNRGLSTPESARQFLEARSPDGADPFNLKTMSEAVDRLHHAIDKHESIAVYGDYDADGVTATALLVQLFKSLGADVQGYIPNRFDEGYGVNKEALTTLHERGVKLVVTVDCGMRSAKETAHANSLGLDLIITDHHLPGDEIPHAIAIINPKQLGDDYPYKDLAGVGLAYKLADALCQSYNLPSETVESYLDLVAIGTVVDMAPLTDENRMLVRQGLLRMRQPARQGVISLIGVSGFRPDRVNASNLGFNIGPRLNAAGRLDTALDAFHLLTTQDVYEAGRLAQQLDIQNRERQKVTRWIQDAAEQIALAEDPDALLIFASHPDFNPGVVGLAASRLCEKYYRPAIVAHQDQEITVGSCRSIPEFHITNALDECSELMEKYGGHAAAAGFTISNENLPTLIDRLKQIARHQLSGVDLRPLVQADAEVTLTDMKAEVLEYLDWLQPTGLGNPVPVFATRGVRVQRYQVIGKESEHLKLVVTDGRITFDAIAFRMAHLANQMPDRLDMMFTFELNEFNGRSTLQLNIRDLKASA